ncbi:MAG: hypothetical protein V7K26_00015 [Nostoc sp.]|uniref:hypothetical protein n=1 Tax=Nostoc sp. TaxID=1180 RepID=UPI002FEFA75B
MKPGMPTGTTAFPFLVVYFFSQCHRIAIALLILIKFLHYFSETSTVLIEQRSQLSLLRYARMKLRIFNSDTRAMPTAGYANALTTESAKIA